MRFGVQGFKGFVARAAMHPSNRGTLEEDRDRDRQREKERERERQHPATPVVQPVTQFQNL